MKKMTMSVFFVTVRDSDIAHQCKTPLTAAAMYAEMLPPSAEAEAIGKQTGKLCQRCAVLGCLKELVKLQAWLAAIRLTGYSLCGIILLIGLMNMVNSTLTSMVLRRREFAILETVGMTRAQLRRMLLYENSVGGVFGLASFVVGSVLFNTLLTQTLGVNIAPISLPAMGILLFLFAAGGVTAKPSYRILIKTSLTERLRLGE